MREEQKYLRILAEEHTRQGCFLFTQNQLWIRWHQWHPHVTLWREGYMISPRHVVYPGQSGPGGTCFPNFL